MLSAFVITGLSPWINRLEISAAMEHGVAEGEDRPGVVQQPITTEWPRAQEPEFQPKAYGPRDGAVMIAGVFIAEYRAAGCDLPRKRCHCPSSRLAITALPASPPPRCVQL